MARKAGRIVWHGPKVIREIEGEMQRRLKEAAEYVRSEAAKNVSTPTSSAGPSKPGDFPHADTGKLRQSIFWTLAGKATAIVGTPLKYGLFLETFLNRSYLRRTLAERAAQVRRILTRKMR